MLNQVALLKHFCNTIWEYDPEKECVYIYHDTMIPEYCGKWEDYGKVFQKYLERYIYRDSVGIWRQYMSTKALREFLDGELNETSFLIQMEYKDDGAQWQEIYLERMEQHVLIAGKDVSEVFKERQKREDTETKYEELLNNMPIAISATEVLLDENGKPYDFRYTYCNPAHEELEGVNPGELTGKNFYEFFEHTDPAWLQLYYETAWLGIPHIIRKYSPEIGKDLLIHTFRTEPGHCDCVIQDITQENFLFRELHQSRAEMMRVLETTTEAVFQYDPETDEIRQNDYTSGGNSSVYHPDELFKIFADNGRVEKESLEVLKDSFSRMKKGEHSVILPIRCRKRGMEQWLWYKLSLFDYLDEITKERKVLGYIQDINQDMTRQRELLAQAQTDALTGIWNVGAGRSHIQKLLGAVSEKQKAMFMMDIDNFKIVNDSYGHMMGDKTLKCLAEILSKVFTDPAVVYRLGGDEFSVFIPELEDAEKKVAELMKKLEEEVQAAKEEFPFLSISVGIYITDSCESYEQFYVAADKALYQTKKNKKGYYTVLDDSKRV